MDVQSLGVSVYINSVNVSQYVTGLDRQSSLCRVGQSVAIKMSAAFAHASYDPWDEVVVYERGIKTLTGYVDEVVAARAPAETTLNCQDTFKRATDYFIPEEIDTQGESTTYWVDYLCGLCGLSYRISTSSGSGNATPLDTPLGLRSVAESLLVVANYSRWNMRVNPDGVLEFFTPVDSAAEADYNFVWNMLSGEHRTSDEKSRTTALVFGYSPTSGEEIRYREDRSVPGVSERIMVFGDPSVQTNAQAAALADMALDQYARLTQEAKVVSRGYADAQVGDLGLSIIRGNRYVHQIATLSASANEGGYSQTVVLGSQCPRFLNFGNRIVDPNLVYVCSSGSVGRTREFLSSGSPAWENVTGGIVSTGFTISDMDVSHFDPVNRGYVSSGSNGIWMTSNLDASPPTWTRVYNFTTLGGYAIKETGLIRGSPAKDGLVYCTARNLNATAFLGMSTDHGLNWTWKQLSPLSPTGVAMPVCPHPEDSQIVYCSVGSGQLLRSTNALGAFTVSTAYTESGGSALITNIAISRSDGSGYDIYIGGATMAGVGRWIEVYDFGAETISKILTTGYGRLSVVRNPVSPGIGFKGSDSTNFGDSFTLGTAGPSNVVNIYDSVYAGSGVVLWVGGDFTPNNTLYRSTDYGLTLVAGGTPGGQRRNRSICMHLGYAYLAHEGNASGSIQRSTDLGVNWDFVSSAGSSAGRYPDTVISNGVYIVAHGVNINPISSPSGDVGSWTELAGALEAACATPGWFFSGTYKSIDGLTWIPTGSAITPLAGTGSDLFAQIGSAGDIYISRDDGASWDFHSGGSLINPFTITYNSIGALFAAGSDGAGGSNNKLYRYYDPISTSFIKISSDLAATFDDITPDEGGAWFKDALDVFKYQKEIASAIPGVWYDDMVIADTDDSGGLWLTSGGSIVGGMALKLSQISPYDHYFLQRSEISFLSSGSDLNPLNKTGDFETAVGGYRGRGRRILPIF